MKPAGPKGLPYNGGVPRHWNCRSAEIPITYTWEELGITGIGETRRVVEGGERASMFGPTKHRSFDSWLGSLEPDEQDSVLGSKRLGAAFRSGQLTSVKQMVDAATGRPLLMREMEAFGLIPERYPRRIGIEQGPDYGAAPGGPGTGYKTQEKWIEDVQKQILDEIRDPRSEYNKFSRDVEKLEYEKIDLQLELENDKLGLVPLTSAERSAKMKRVKAIEGEQRRLNARQAGFLARKYVAPLTPGRADIGALRGEAGRDAAVADYQRRIDLVRRDLQVVNDEIADLKAKGKPIPPALLNEKKRLTKIIGNISLDINRARTPLNPKVEEALDEAVDLVETVLGENSTLAREWTGLADAGYWQGLTDSERFDIIEMNGLTRAGRKDLAFHFGDTTDYRGGGSHGLIRLQDRDAAKFENIVHEMGHHLELSDEETMRRIHDYIHARTGAQFGTPAHIQESAFKPAYSLQQCGFVREYGGNIYGWDWKRPNATEFLSVSFEALLQQTELLIRQDPQTFEFMLRFLTNRWDGWDYSGVFGG